MRRKTKRLIVRLSVFCAVFCVFSVYYGVGFTIVKNREAAYRVTADRRAFLSLREYMASVGGVLRQIKRAEPKSPEVSALVFSLGSLTGGAKAVLGSLPLGRTEEGRLQSYFSGCEEYIKTVYLGAGGYEYNFDGIDEYIRYNDIITDRLNSLGGADLAGLTEYKNLFAELQIDTPPQPRIRSAGGEASPVAKDDSNNNKTAGYILDSSEAKKRAKLYLGQYSPLRERGAKKGDYYRFDNGSAFVDILRAGGAVLRYSASKACPPDKIKLTMAEARLSAKNFIKEAGAGEVVGTAQRVLSGRYEAEFTSEGAAGPIYVGVSLDNGKVVYYDASEFYGIN